MKATVIFVVLTILGSLCQGKPVNKKKRPVKLKDKPLKGKEIIIIYDITKMNFSKLWDPVSAQNNILELNSSKFSSFLY